MWRKYRRSVELLQALLITGIPFLSVNGQSALRFDIGELKLYFLGTVIRIGEFYLLLAAVLFLLLLITFVTAIFGRIWCGWLCPQTVLLDLSESFAAKFGIKNSKTVRSILLLPLSALVSLTLIWYFVPPMETLQALFTSLPVTAFFLVLWAVIYLELAFLGRRFCISICPYAMMQNAIFDKDTLVIEYDRSRDDTCMKCDSCVKVCPVGIDIKAGLSTRCIACAECIDACSAKSEPRGLAPFPNYKGRILRAKTFWMGGITAAAGALFILLLAMRPQADFLITRDQEPLPEGLNRYSWTVFNNSGRTLDLELSAAPGVTIIGEQSLRLKPYAALRGKVLIKAGSKVRSIRFTLEGSGISISKETGFL